MLYLCASAPTSLPLAQNTLVLRHEVTVLGEEVETEEEGEYCTECMSHDFVSMFVFVCLRLLLCDCDCVCCAAAFCAFIFFFWYAIVALCLLLLVFVQVYCFTSLSSISHRLFGPPFIITALGVLQKPFDKKRGGKRGRKHRYAKQSLK